MLLGLPGVSVLASASATLRRIRGRNCTFCTPRRYLSWISWLRLVSADSGADDGRRLLISPSPAGV
jgi:hypothetical protein